MQNHQRRALVLFSGGQDSTTCLAWALERYAHVETVAFDYGQRHRIELDARLTVLARIRERFPDWAPRLGEDHLLDLKVLGRVGDTAMTSDRAIEMQANGLLTPRAGPQPAVPDAGRRAGLPRQLDVLVGGMCETDFSGYPDCRDDTIKAQQVALGLGLGARVTIETPLMWIDKSRPGRWPASWAATRWWISWSRKPHLLPGRARRARTGVTAAASARPAAAQGGLGQVGRGRPSGRLTPGTRRGLRAGAVHGARSVFPGG